MELDGFIWIPYTYPHPLRGPVVPSKGIIILAPSKGTGSIAPGKGTGSISPYYDDTFFIFLYKEEPNYMDLLFSPIYGINNLTNTRMR